MSELGEPRWALISERGCEAAGLTYEEAARLMRRLVSENVHGTAIVSERAARRLAPENLAKIK